MSFNQQINSLTPTGEAVDVRWLYVALLLAKRRVQRASTNRMKAMVNKGETGRGEIPTPPIITVLSRIGAIRLCSSSGGSGIGVSFMATLADVLGVGYFNANSFLLLLGDSAY